MRHMKRIATVLAVLLSGGFATVSTAAPPFSVTTTFSGAPGASGHRLYQGCRAGETKALIGPVSSGQTFANLIASAGTYSFCVHGFNATGEGPSSNVAVVNIQDVQPPPGAPSNFTITIQCAFLPDGVTPSCTFVVTSEPAP